MKKELRWKAILCAFVFVLSVVYLMPSVLGRDLSWWPSGRLNLGLDLKGGMHIVYAVKTMRAVHAEIVRLKEDIGERFEREGFPYTEARVTDENELVLTFASRDHARAALAWMEEETGDYETYAVNNLGFSVRMEPELIRDVERTALDQAREKIMRRVDQFGVREPYIAPQGDDRIVVRLPGVVDPEQAKRLLGTTAVLHFKIVPPNGYAETREALLARLGDEIPEGFAIYPGRVEEGVPEGFYLLPIEPAMTGQHLTDARPGFDEYGANSVNFRFDAEGARQFGELTAANIDQPLAIVLDDIVMGRPPTIRSKITSRGQITGTFTREETRNFAIVLRSGSLPVPVEIEEERTVGPLLGHDSIQKGAISFIIGGVLVLIFMVIYYKVSGFIANLALVMNIMMILGGLTLFDATLTFPGIAGIILTVGMAVDANVIIFERIREELRVGKTPRAAIDTGYRKALWTILDANITTGLAALILFQFGTGPVKGFAVTLTIGIVASVFTAVVVTRLIFDLWADRPSVRSLSI